MKIVDFLIIGGGVAGTTAAGVLRVFKPQASITIISDENYEMYSRVLLPNYIRGEIERDKVFLKNTLWYEQNKIELVRNNKARKLLPREKLLEIENGELYKYGKLLIAIGAKPIKLKCEGADLGNVFYMWTMDDADGIIKACQGAKRGVIIGGGFIGLEFAHSFKVAGITTTIIEGAPYYWGNRLDEESSKVLQNILAENGIKVVYGDLVEKFIPNNFSNVGSVVTRSGQQFGCDLVGIGIGIRSDLSWLSGSGIKIDNGIVTNEYLETNLPDVYAAGDCCEFYDVICEGPHLVGTWANATTQGLTVAKTMVHSASSGQAGKRTVFEAVSSYTINFFGASCSFIGMTEKGFADEVIERGSVEAGKLTRFFLKKFGGRRPGEASGPEGVVRIVGATVINGPAEVAPISSAIRSKKDVSGFVGEIGNLNFDLKDLAGS